MNKYGLGLFVSLLLSVSAVNGICPQADLSGDCRVNLADFSILAKWWLLGCTPGDCEGTDLDASGAVGIEDLSLMASQWLTVGHPDLSAVVWVDINEAGGFVGQMSRYLITNAQYAAFLNAMNTANLIFINQWGLVYGTLDNKPYYQLYGDYPYSQIYYENGVFSVRTRDDQDMSTHPVSDVSWFGAKAFCDYYGYRLPTELEWQAVADFDGTYVYGCGTIIDAARANFNDENDPENDGYGNNPLGLSEFPYTTPVDYYPSFGYGFNDMAGNLNEWTSTAGQFAGTRIIRGGSWYSNTPFCTVTWRLSIPEDNIVEWFGYDTGFRVCRDMP